MDSIFFQHEEKSLLIQTFGFERSFYFSAGKNFCHRLKLDLRRQVKLYQTRFQNPAFLISVTVVLRNKRFQPIHECHKYGRFSIVCDVASFYLKQPIGCQKMLFDVIFR